MGQGIWEGGGELQPLQNVSYLDFFWAARKIWAKQIFNEVYKYVCLLFFISFILN